MNGVFSHLSCRTDCVITVSLNHHLSNLNAAEPSYESSTFKLVVSNCCCSLLPSHLMNNIILSNELAEVFTKLYLLCYCRTGPSFDVVESSSH